MPEMVKMPEKVTVDTRTIVSVIHTLKMMADSGKIAGYENMDKLVGLVMLFDSILAKSTEEAKEEGDK